MFFIPSSQCYGGKKEYVMKSRETLTLSQLADRLHAEYQGDGHCVVKRLATLQSAQAGDISFLSSSRYKAYLSKTKASVVILTREDATECNTNMLIVDDPYYAFAKLSQWFDKPSSHQAGRHSTAVIADTAEIDPTVYIGPYVVIADNVKIGAHVIIEAGTTVGADCSIDDFTHIYPNVSIYHDVHIGKRVIIHSGAVIGSDGFGFAKNEGRWHKIHQLGGVRIGDEVEIGANTAIDRGAIKDTVIDEDVKLDNLIQIGHSVEIGAHTAISGTSAIAGSAKIGKDCLLGGGVGIGGHIQIVDNVALTARSSVSRSITMPGVYSSGAIPVMPNKDWNKCIARFRQLDKIWQRMRKLEKLHGHDGLEAME